jgi:putative acetyltransferase
MILDHARAAGLTRVSLETGSLEGSAAARRLYEREGFDYCAPFAEYRGRPDERLHDPHALNMDRAPRLGYSDAQAAP